MKNQFNSRTPTDVIDALLERATHGPTMREAYDAAIESPDACMVPDGAGQIFVRHGGKKYNVAVRSIIYYLHAGDLPVLGPSACGTKGCVNPLHQAPAASVTFKTLDMHAAE